ncbi:MAG: DNA primase DnaG [Candidatus Altiarchaeota archaeon]
MAKAPADTIKYNIYADITIDGVVEKPDVVGAIFGQSEGLLGEELELRDLQKTGRIGRIEVDIKAKGGKSIGVVIVPSSLDMVETSIIAAAVEGVDRVGPCNAKILVKNIEDARNQRRKVMIERAKGLLKRLMDEEIPESTELTDEVKKSVQLSEITTYNGLPAGPGLDIVESVILVEGRADVLTLLKHGIKNVLAVGGTSIPKAVSEVSKTKTTIVFVDGDRGGEIILKELLAVADIDFIAKAPSGKEVEELSKKEVIMALRRKLPPKQEKGNNSPKNDFKKDYAAAPAQKPRGGKPASPDVTGALLDELSAIKGKLSARLYDKDMNVITEIEIKDLVNSLSDVQPKYVVFDGIITQRLVDAASKSRVEYIVGVNKSAVSDAKKVNIITDKESK